MPAGVGFQMQEFVLGWLAVQLAVREGDPSLGGLYLGLRSVAAAVPSLGVGLFAGVLADRMDRRALLLRSRVASAAVAVAATVLVLTDHVGIGVLMLLSAGASAAYVFDPPSRQAILPKVVPFADLFSAVGLVRVSLQSAHTVGPLVAGLLIVPFGPGGVMVAMAALVILSIGMLVPMRDQPVSETARAVGVMRSLREGFDHVRRDDLIRWCVIAQILFAVLGQSFMQLLPAIAVDTLGAGARELSWMAAAVGLGSLVGAFFIASAARVERLGALFLGLTASAGAMLVALGLQREIIDTVAVLVVLGVLHQLFMGVYAVILQLSAPDRLRGRIMAIMPLVFQGFVPLGVLLLGALGTLIGISSAIGLAGAVVVAVAASAWLRVGAFRTLRRTVAMELARAEAAGAG